MRLVAEPPVSATRQLWPAAMDGWSRDPEADNELDCNRKRPPPTGGEEIRLRRDGLFGPSRALSKGIVMQGYSG